MASYTIDMESISSSILTGLLLGNKYLVSFNPVGSKVQNVFQKNIGLLANSVNLPTHTYSTKQTYVGGSNIEVVNMYEQGQFDMTLYNSGAEYKTISLWGDAQYNQATRAYSFPNDTIVNIAVAEYSRTGNKVLTHNFEGCNLLNYGGIQLSYEEATQIETFSLTVAFRASSISYI